MSNLLKIAEDLGLNPRKNGVSEYETDCPRCGISGQLVLWPDKIRSEKQIFPGRYWCRECNTSGDVIDFCKFKGMGYREAVEALEGQIGSRARAPNPFFSARQTQKQKQLEKSSLWRKRALDFVIWSHRELLGNGNAIEYLASRGINAESIARFQLGCNPKDLWDTHGRWGMSPCVEAKPGGKKRVWLAQGLVIPTFSCGEVTHLKVRRSNLSPNDRYGRYVVVSGSCSTASVFGDRGARLICLCEGELDAILLAQEIGCCAIATGGAGKLLGGEVEALCATAARLVVVPDNDAAGEALVRKLAVRFPRIEVVHVPEGKDATEAWQRGVELKGLF